MGLEVLGELNWWAVVVATAIYWVLGALWFSPVLFQKPWLASMGYTPDPDESPGASVILFPALTCAVTTIGVGVLGAWTGAQGFGDGVRLGLVLCLGLAMTLIGVTAFFEPTKASRSTWWWTNASYHVVGIFVAAVLLAAWH
jgi:hypothetical protein